MGMTYDATLLRALADEPEDGWLIIKRNLFYAPNCQGYTGIRDRAGRYNKAFAKSYCGCDLKMVHESVAPEFLAGADKYHVIDTLTRQRDEARAEVAALRALASTQEGK